MIYFNLKKKHKGIILILLFGLTTLIFGFLPMNDGNTLDNNSFNIDTDQSKAIELPVQDDRSPESSEITSDEWWDSSFSYRRLINVTNPYGIDFVNYGVNVTFNYDELVSEGKLRSDLYDIRVVENGIPRKYIFKIDYPSENYVTVFFNVNITVSTTDKDTYVYFGNSGASDNRASGATASDSFGWIKNGDFELDYSTDTTYNPFGWTFTHDPVDYIDGTLIETATDATDSSAGSIALFENKVVSGPSGGERVASGSYSYKWGSNLNTLTTGIMGCHDYAGVLYSNVFTVPNVTGGGLELNIFRNIRTYRFEHNDVARPIDTDGYFIRLSKASSYGSDPDDHVVVDGGNGYKEIYGGYATAELVEQGQSGKFKLTWYNDELLEKHYHDIVTKDTDSTSINDGQLTGYIDGYSLTEFMGQEVFLEIGVWGDERADYNVQDDGKYNKAAFFNIDDIRFNYWLETDINEVQRQQSEVTIVTTDVDGRLVPNAEVFFVNDTSGEVKKTGFTGPLNASKTFSLSNGVYNITVNYSLSSNLKEVVYNSSTFNEITYYFIGGAYSYVLRLNLTTIDFEIADTDGNPLTLGYVNVSYYKGSDVLKKLNLDSSYGTASFCWLNRSSYYYEVYYDNDDYAKYKNPTSLVNGTYTHTSIFDKTQRSYSNILWVNQTNTYNPALNQYHVDEESYANGSLLGPCNKKIINATISLTDMGVSLNYVKVYYIDRDGNYGIDNLIYSKTDYSSQNSDTVVIDVKNPQTPCDNLESDGCEVYGFWIDIEGTNQTGVRCDGIIEINTTETINIYNRTALAKLNIRFVRNLTNEIQPVLLQYIYVNYTDEYDYIAKLYTKADKDGYATGVVNTEIPFWYLKDKDYNFTIRYYNEQKDFNISTSTESDYWNYWGLAEQEQIIRLNNSATIYFNLHLAADDPLENATSRLETIYSVSSVVWGQSIRLEVNYSYSIDNGETWIPLDDPEEITCSVIRLSDQQDMFTEDMIEGNGDGNFTVTINSGRLFAGSDGVYYYLDINVVHGYGVPEFSQVSVFVDSVSTAISSHTYSPTSISATSKTAFSQYYDELINITIKYCRSDTDALLGDASLNHTWLSSEKVINEDPINDDYFTFTINTSQVASIGIEIIQITAELDNYSSKSLTITLEILVRPTSINGTAILLHNSTSIWVNDSFVYIYRYVDTLIPSKIGEAVEAKFYWYKLDNQGNPIGDPSPETDMVKTSKDDYRLDFKTEDKQVGDYAIFITLQKSNFEARNAFIDLRIRLRQFTLSLDSKNNQTTKISVIKGYAIVMELTLNRVLDPTSSSSDKSITTQASAPLTGAKVTLTINEFANKTFKFTEIGSGLYRLILNTSDPSYEAFFASQTLTGIITIEKENYVTQTIDITIVVGMDELIPGFPTFYLLLLIIAIGTIVGSLTTYRYVQIRSVPKFVRRVKHMKEAVKKKHVIPGSLIYPSKDVFYVKQFRNKWNMLGLSLDKIMGVGLKKESKLKELKQKLKTLDKGDA